MQMQIEGEHEPETKIQCELLSTHTHGDGCRLISTAVQNGLKLDGKDYIIRLAM
jgi:hypothetical protein